ncbi:chemokine XC receptor 1-like [Acipenser oxyrinchus oxyrinchus]|uniref:Chemokine XC receptor 1-like n=1 Tax=Acipenser oxyrinchus oxyrinchus TaxID=40147 RepID=A0AAD8LSB6_ACIOX|nr:chemokine XC receptor 1-like [Acipenser oxyrinchus oxyrinchus]
MQTTTEYILNTSYTDDYENDYNGSIVLLCEYDLHAFVGIFTSVFYCLVFTLSVLGNGLVLCVLLKYEDKKKVINIFILNLAISDLALTFSLPFWAVYHSYNWIFGDFMCKLLSGMYFIGFYSCMMFLMVMTIHRYLTVVHNVSTTKTRRTWYAWLASATVWVISISASIREMVFSATQEDNQGTMCEDTYSNGKISDFVDYCIQIFFFFLLPFSIIMYCYCRIVMTVVACTTRTKYNVIKFIFSIVVTFFVCWAPYNIILFLRSLHELGVAQLTGCDVEKKINYSFYICRNIAYFHCCLNPLFHLFVQNLRRNLSTLICNTPMQGTVRKHRNSIHSSSNSINKAALVHEGICMSSPLQINVSRASNVEKGSSLV